MSLSEVKYPSTVVNSFLFLIAVITGLYSAKFNFTEFITVGGIDYVYPFFYSLVGAFVFDTLFKTFGCYDTNTKRTFGIFLTIGLLWLLLKNTNEILPVDISETLKFVISILGLISYAVLFQVAYEKQMKYLGIGSATLVIVAGSGILFFVQVMINMFIFTG